MKVKNGNKLERKPGMFFWRGRYFHGLVTDNALYDDPEDSFMEHLGFINSLQAGRISIVNDNTTKKD